MILCSKKPIHIQALSSGASIRGKISVTLRNIAAKITAQRCRELDEIIGAKPIIPNNPAKLKPNNRVDTGFGWLSERNCS